MAFPSAIHNQPTTFDRSTPTDHVTILRPRHGWQPLHLAELVRYRDLLWFLAMRDILVRYKQTVLGVLWAVLQPLAMMILFTLFFGRLMDVADKTPGTPYPIFVYAGLLPWMLFAAAVTASSQSLVTNAQMLSKVYFPRLIMPVATLGAPLVDFAISFLILLGLMWWFAVSFSWQLILLPLLIGTTILAVLGVGVLLAALTVTYRDFKHVIPFMIQIWFFLTPVIYPVSIVPPRFAWLLNLNPMSGTICAFRAAVLGTPVDYGAWAISAAVAIVLLILALAYFNRTERRFADVV